MKYKLSITALIVFPLIALIFLLGLVGSLVLRQTIDKNVQEMLVQLSVETHKQANTYVQNFINQAELTLELTQPFFSKDYSEGIDVRQIVNLFGRQLQQLPFADYLYFTSDAGQIVSVGKSGQYAFSTPQEPTRFRMYPDLTSLEPDRIREDLDFRKKDWYINAKTSEHEVWTAPYPGEQEDTVAISVSKRVMSENGQLNGVLGMDILLPKLDARLRSIDITAGSFLFLSDDSQLISSNQLTDNAQTTKIVELWTRKFDDIDDFATTQLNGENFLLHRTLLDINNQAWQLLTAIPESSINVLFEPLIKQLRITYLLLVLFITLGITAVMFFVRQQINEFISIMQTLSDDHWSNRFPSLFIKELNEVARNFNVLLEKLSLTLGSLSKNQHTLDDLNKNLESIVKEKTAELSELAIKDPLTGCYNRRFIDNILCENSDHLSAVALIDLDFFKTINDTYGHALGDEILKDLVAFFKSRIRKGDVFGRYGGDEFVLIFDDTSVEEAKSAMERYQVEYQSQPHSSQLLNVTLSCGIAEVDKTESRENLIKADKALYKAKELGRNRVEIYREE